MIRSFRTVETEGIWRGKPSRRFALEVQSVVRRKLRMVNNAQVLVDLRVPPGNRLEALRGDRKGQFSIRVNDRLRICFAWRDGDCHDIELTDYH
jgi:proteic killer suppression protein